MHVHARAACARSPAARRTRCMQCAVKQRLGVCVGGGGCVWVCTSACARASGGVRRLRRMCYAEAWR